MKRLLMIAVMTATAACTGSGSPNPNADRYDVVILNGRVIDGSGSAPVDADIGIVGDRIKTIGDLKTAAATTKIDANGLVVAPGFIDLLGQSEFNVLVDPRAASKIMQGVTTEVTGEGDSIAPLNDRMIADRKASWDHFGVAQNVKTLTDYFARLQRAPPTINVATFVGSGGIRDYVIGPVDRKATPDELDAMKKLVAEAMQQGALGVSSSLQYVPNRFASTDELIELAKVAGSYGGIYITHQRSEGNKIFESLDEVFAIAEKANIPAEIWHLKTAYKANWGKMPDVLKRIEAARARGLRVGANIYPYNRASNDLDACLPIWAREGGTVAMIERLKDPAQRARIKKEMDDPNAPFENQWYGSGGSDGVMVSAVLNPSLRQYEGMTLTQIGQMMKKDPRDAAMDLIREDNGETSCIISYMNDDDVRTALKHPLISFGSDSGAKAEDGKLSVSKSHPRAWGTFPRILGRYVRDEKLISLEEAIRKMTSQAAERVGLKERGLLNEGLFADITIFDPTTVKDVSTFEDPTHYSTGIRYVLVNGKAVVANGAITAERPGRPLYGPGLKSAATN